MSFDTYMHINNNQVEKQFLREHSYWYKYLNRSNTYYKDFINDMKEKYKLTTTDKLNKMINDINMFKSFLDVLK